MGKTNRRDFLKAGIGASVLAGLGGASALSQTTKRSATDWVTLGRSGVKVTRLAFGTGTRGGSVQRSLGQEEFTRLVRHAYDRGIRFFETSETYFGMPEMLAAALKGVPRDSYKLMTKYRTPANGPAPAERVDQFRKALNSEYIDICCYTASARPPGSRTTGRSRTGFRKRRTRRSFLPMELPFTVCPRCARFPETAGSISP